MSPPLSSEKGRSARSLAPPLSSPSPSSGLYTSYVIRPGEVCARDPASLWRMQLQGPVFVGVPLLGPILIWMFTHQLSSRCEDERKLPWCPPHKVILLVWATIYSVMGYASYLVWKDLGGGFRWPLALPLGLYSFQLTLSWTFLMLFLAVDSPGLALLDLLLLYGLVASMVFIWQPINKLAALLLLPYLAWLTVTTAITYRLWRDSLCPAYEPLPSEESG